MNSNKKQTPDIVDVIKSKLQVQSRKKYFLRTKISRRRKCSKIRLWWWLCHLGNILYKRSTVYFKWVNCVACELYLNKAVLFCFLSAPVIQNRPWKVTLGFFGINRRSGRGNFLNGKATSLTLVTDQPSQAVPDVIFTLSWTLSRWPRGISPLSLGSRRQASLCKSQTWGNWGSESLGVGETIWSSLPELEGFVCLPPKPSLPKVWEGRDHVQACLLRHLLPGWQGRWMSNRIPRFELYNWILQSMALPTRRKVLEGWLRGRCMLGCCLGGYWLEALSPKVPLTWSPLQVKVTCLRLYQNRQWPISQEPPDHSNPVLIPTSWILLVLYLIEATCP